MDWKLAVLLVVSILSIGTSLVLSHVVSEYRKWWLQERESASQAIAAQKELIDGQEQAIKGLRAYTQIKEAMLFDSIEYLIASLREYMPAEKDVPRNEEPDEWYRAVNAIFLAEKRVREIKEAR